MPLPVAVVLALLTGLGAGMVNAVGVTFFRVPPIIMTLGTLGVYRGTMLLVTGGSWIETIPQSIKSVAGWRFLEVPFMVWMAIALAILTAVALRVFKQARNFYAVGDNEEGAYLLGIPVKATVFAAYCLAGLLCRRRLGGLCRADRLRADADRQRPGTQGNRRPRAWRRQPGRRRRHDALGGGRCAVPHRRRQHDDLPQGAGLLEQRGGRRDPARRGRSSTTASAAPSRSSGGGRALRR